jgi:hypothetical protein
MLTDRLPNYWSNNLYTCNWITDSADNIRRTAWSGVLLEKLIVAQLIRIIPIIYGTQRLINVFKGAHDCNQVHMLTSYFFTIHFNTFFSGLFYKRWDCVSSNSRTDDELERIWKETVWLNRDTNPAFVRRSRGKFSKDNWSPGRGSSTGWI